MRGCTFSCKYCQTSRIVRGEVRFRSLATIEQIVRHYVDVFKSTHDQVDIRILAPNSLGWQSTDGKTANVDALWELVRTIKKYPVKLYLGSFPSEVRPEFVTPETAKILAESTSNVVAVGGQSGSDSMLKKMARRHTVADIRTCVRHLLAANLIPQIDFIIASPGETEQEQLQTLELIKELVDQKCRILLHHFMPLPGTPWSGLEPSDMSARVLLEVRKLIQNPLVDGAFFKQHCVAMRGATGIEKKEEKNDGEENKKEQSERDGEFEHKAPIEEDDDQRNKEEEKGKGKGKKDEQQKPKKKGWKHRKERRQREKERQEQERADATKSVDSVPTEAGDIASQPPVQVDIEDLLSHANSVGSCPNCQ